MPKLKFTLRVKLIFASIFLLAIPLSGFWYVSNMMSFLLKGQEQVVSLTARSVTAILNNSPNLFKRNILESVDEEKEYPLYRLPNKIKLDGNKQDWPNRSKQIELNNKEQTENKPLSFSHQVGRIDNYLYALFDVQDKNIILRNPNTLHLEKSDHLQILLRDIDGELKKYLISPVREGWVTAHEMSLKEKTFIPVKNETKIHGFWKNNANGYLIEMRIPFSHLGNKLIFSINDVDEPSGKVINSLSTGRKNKSWEMKTVLTSSADIKKILSYLEIPDTKIWVVDKKNRIRASIGSLDNYIVSEPENLFRSFANKAFRFIYEYYTASSPARNETKPYLSVYDFTDLKPTLEMGKSVSMRKSLSGGNTEIIIDIEPLTDSADNIIGAVVVEQTTDNILLEKRHIIEDTIYITLVVFIIGTLFLFIFASRLSSRIRKLSNDADNAIGKDGKIISSITSTDASDEIGDLSRNLAAMITRLKKVADYQEKMANNLEHELRTPLAGISASLINLKREIGKGDKSNEYLVGALENLTKTEGILSKIRDASMLEEALKQGEFEEFDLCKAMTAWGNFYELSFPETSFDITIPEGEIIIFADPERIYQMMDKLVENSVDFSTPNSTVIIKLIKNKKNAEITIINEGEHINNQTMDQMFNSMVSLRTVEKSDGIHMGLGLYIVRTIIDHHRGSIQAKNIDNDPPDKVAFIVRLPLG